MEPKLPAPNIEQLPTQYNQNLERIPGVTPELNIEQEKEQLEQRAEASREQRSPTVIVPNTQVALPTLSQSPVGISSLPTDDNPVVANDDDLIEKEWVDKAKKIIVETKDDPYRREKEIGKLQVDYLRKRYGKELGSPE
jgi:hypothetical protein